MTRKQIDTMRETRLWFGQIFVPVALGTMTIMANPELKEKVKEKASTVKNVLTGRYKIKVVKDKE